MTAGCRQGWRCPDREAEGGQVAAILGLYVCYNLESKIFPFR